VDGIDGCSSSGAVILMEMLGSSLLSLSSICGEGEWHGCIRLLRCLLQSMIQTRFCLDLWLAITIVHLWKCKRAWILVLVLVLGLRNWRSVRLVVAGIRWDSRRVGHGRYRLRLRIPRKLSDLKL